MTTLAKINALLVSIAVIIICLLFFSHVPPAHALPSGGQVAEGAATIHQPNAGSLRIDQFSDRALLNWHGFSIGEAESVQFVQPSATALAVNRVLGGDPSLILGRLLANGRVFLLNPNGVLFGPNATVNVGGLVASTLSLKSYDLTTGRFELAQDPTKALAAVVNQGTLRVADHGFLVLAAPGVVNDGLIVAKFGQVGLAAGTQMTVDFRGDGLIQYAVEGKVLDQVTDPNGQRLADALSNAGRIEADGGTVLLTAQASSAVVSSVINQTGVIQARRLESQGGEIVLRGGDEGWVTVDGKLDANGGTVPLSSAQMGTVPLTTESGGTIEIAGNRLFLLGEAQANGIVGGKVTVQAETVFQSGSLTANGSVGDGGTVSVSATRHVIQMTSALTSVQSGEQGAGGTIVIQGGDKGGVFTSGTLLATGQKGGTIHVLGGDLTLAAATGDASGNLAGGTILIGGDYQGRGVVPRSATTIVNPFTTLKADAHESGPGGKIIVWSDGETQFYGSASVRAGALAGDGGLIEVSGKEALYFGGIADAGSSAGVAGTVLLDPKFITISSSGTLPQYQILDPNSDPDVDSGFGLTVVPLTTGNVVVTAISSGGGSQVGAVYLFNGSTGALISTLTGGTNNDQVSSGGVTALTNGHFVVQSPNWDNGVTANAGAVTWGNGTTGVSGLVSTSNSLVGSSLSDQVGSGGVTALTNGNYVVASPLWNGVNADTGAVTWMNGATGKDLNNASGAVGVGNSLVGSTASDQVGIGGVTALTNGHYVVRSYLWDNGPVNAAGAVTWMNGTTGKTLENLTGAVSTANSLVGSTAADQVGLSGVMSLTNGNYVVSSANWNGGVVDVGAVTWMNGATGKTLENLTGPVSTANSLYGSSATDFVGSEGVTALTNGNYVVVSRQWISPGVGRVGAVTWGNGATGTVGPVSATNSLVGSTANDQVGVGGVTPLTNGNYVVSSTSWDGGAADVGAATWINGSNGNDMTGNKGPVSFANSLYGSTASDGVGNSVTALTNGHYAVASPNWDNGGIVNVGAATFGNGTTGTSGAVSAANSRVGSTANDQVSSGGITALTNGFYVVASPNWDGAFANVGAVTWGTAGFTGGLSAANSLVGSTANDRIGSGGVTALTNGHYVVRSPLWDGPGAVDAGAVTRGIGTGGTIGSVASANSLVGSTASDQVGSGGVTALANGHYVVRSPLWGTASSIPSNDVSAVTWGNGTTGVSGPVSAANSILGDTINGEGLGSSMALDNVTGTFLTLGTSRLVLGFQDPASGVTFASGGGQSMTIGTTFLTRLLETSSVILQASTDLTMAASAVLQPTSGNFGLTFEAGRSIIFDSNSQVILNGGDFHATINDEGAVAANRDAGTAQFNMTTGAQIITNGGDVTIDVGTFGGSPLGGVRIGNGVGPATINSAGGDISISAQSSSPGGILLNSGSTVQSTTGSITFTGTAIGGSGAGVSLSGANTKVTTSQGSISLTGTGAGFSNGLEVLVGASIPVTGSGSIMLIGSSVGTGLHWTSGGGLGGPSATGAIALRASTVTLSNVQIQTTGSITLEPLSASGNIGISGGAGEFELNTTELGLIQPGASGVFFGRADGTGAVTVGPGGFTSQNPLTIRSGLVGGAGSITVNGPLATTGTNSLTFEAGAQITVGPAGTVTVGTGALSITADALTLNGAADSIQGSGTVLLQPQASTTIGLGTGAPGTFNLTGTELLTIKDGFSSITIGRSDGLHTITINDVTFRDPVTIQTPLGGSITINGTLPGTGLKGTGNASIKLVGSGATTNLNADIVTEGQPIIIDDSVIVEGGDVTRTLNTTANNNPQGADIVVTGTINAQTVSPNNESLTANAGTAGNLALGSGDLVTPTYDQPIGGTVPLENLTTDSHDADFPATNLTGTLDAYGTGTGTFNGVVVVGADGNITMQYAEMFLFGNMISPNATLTATGPVFIMNHLTLDVGVGSLILQNDVNTQTFNLTLRGNGIDLLGGPGSVTGSGTNLLALAPGTTTASWGLADGAGTLQISTTDLNALAGGGSGFGTVRFGRDDSTATVTLGTYAFPFPLLIQVKNPQGAEGSIVVTGDVATSTTGHGITLVAGRNIVMSPGASLTTSNGPIMLTGNAAGTTDGNFVGIDVNGATLTAGGGPITLLGHGGTTGNDNIGIRLTNNAQVVGGSGLVTLTGLGGSGGTGQQNVGVSLQGGSQVTTTTGGIQVTGTGGTNALDQGGLPTGQFNRGVQLVTGAQVLSTGSGPITMLGQGGASGTIDHGLAINSRVASAGGAIDLTGLAGGTPTGMNNHGLILANGAQVEGTGPAAIHLKGTGGQGIASDSVHGEAGVYIIGTNGTFVRTQAGALTLEGTGGGTSFGGYGVIVRFGAVVESTGGGTVLLKGTGSPTGTAFNHGVIVYEAGTAIRATGAAALTLAPGQGGGTQYNNYGVMVGNGALVEHLGTGTLTITGTGGGNGDNEPANYGVLLLGATTQIKALQGEIVITGTGAGTPPAQGVFQVGSPVIQDKNTPTIISNP